MITAAFGTLYVMRPGFGELPRGLLTGVAVDLEDRETGPRPCQLPGDPAAETRPCPRDDRDLAAELSSIRTYRDHLPGPSGKRLLDGATLLGSGSGVNVE